jgi:hypothetical protein
MFQLFSTKGPVFFFQLCLCLLFLLFSINSTSPSATLSLTIGHDVVGPLDDVGQDLGLRLKIEAKRDKWV